MEFTTSCFEYLKNTITVQDLIALPRSIFVVIDFTEKKYYYCKPNIDNQLTKTDAESFFGRISLQEFERYNNKVIPQWLEFLKNGSLAHYANYIFSRNQQFKTIDGNSVQLLIKVTFASNPTNEKPVVAVGLIIDITHFKTDNSVVQTIEKVSGNDIQLINKKMLELRSEAQYVFSEKEMQILQCMSEGMSSKQIAGKYGKSIYTINNHRKNMLRKAGCKNSIELMHHHNG